MQKISFLGDIMCEEPFLKAARSKEGNFDFSRTFSGMKALCAKSDYVIGNLESPFAGEEKNFSSEMYSFNTPDVFVDAVKDMGVSFVLTANNHCYDRGEFGLHNTIKVLERANLPYTGTFADSVIKPAIVDVDGLKIAIISCTDSTNIEVNGLRPDEKKVCLLKPQIPPKISRRQKIKNAIKFFVGGDGNYMALRRKLGLRPKNRYWDKAESIEAAKPYIDRICVQIQNVKDSVDLVLVCPHMGGQFNETPGPFCEYVCQCFYEAGADAVIASHPHVVQRVIMKKNVPCAFSLGNVSMSMSTKYIIREGLPDYGMMLHLYISDKRIVKVSFSIIKMLEEKRKYLLVKPVYDLWNSLSGNEKEKLLNEVEKVVRRILCDEHLSLSDISEEYVLYDNQLASRIL